MENKDLENVINKWFEMKYQTYDKLEHEDSIYFYYDGMEYADIRIDKKYKYIYYKWALYKEFSEIISKKYHEFEMVMIKWVEDTLGLKGLKPIAEGFSNSPMLEIPK